ncbi:bifunctional 3-(3-hydroxy-phenyl)propionate/3-hydroxycinnamic acid hydroxylase MhpA [Nocardioides bruguierae]|uniref:Bifunctional 3-(3-hydroxy-phenyl)propionate/3-hydroxycinnamic acid hydroxylase n=1 Tax=Nocardioides bruguierae TaxID=2945102 RepID=A0A9X2D9S7_9ACTN|nr:bifunctional 3-(3-hydroxy-phenyl)propionate/3-hydroxycinnamic acid hydroxylase [Nocardioides bruguierae]MCM0621422.1 bifunctional 3-(3-hydroxy-phenyl)propionate/3-hydroxycinnamic acid hydroxylase [Nocardioides bruguierae]
MPTPDTTPAATSAAAPSGAVPATADVAIVGFGPVGKLLALRLGRAGHRVLVVDRNLAGYPLPRAVTHCSDFARILQSVGLGPDTIGEVTQPYDDMYVWRDAEGRSLVEVDWSGLGESGWYNTYFFSQPALEDKLDDLVAQLPSVTVCRGWQATGIEQDADGATLSLRATDGDEEAVVRASWLIGADGANSAVRRWSGIEWADLGFFYDWLVVDVIPDPALEFPHVARQNCDPHRPATMVPGGPGRRRWEFMRLPHETKDELNRAETAWKLLEPYGLTEENSVLERHSVYTFQACWATRWRDGRVLLAGDAAHLMPPFAGQGLGAGVRDAMNLGWKLDAVLSGRAPEALLDTYGAERLPHARAFIDFSVGLGKVICLTDEAEAAARDERMIAEWAAGMKPPAPPRPGLGEGLHAGEHGGALAIQARLSVGGEEPRLADDALDGPGALVVSDAAQLAGLDADTLAGLRSLGITPVALDGLPSPEVLLAEDVDGTWTTWLADLGVSAVLVRPDFHLYGAGDDAVALATGFLRAVATCGQEAPVPA